MAQPLVPLSSHILNQLSIRESRLLTLVVAVRRALRRDEHVKGDLADAVKSCLQKLILARTVKESDGMFSLTTTPPRGGFARLSTPVAPPRRAMAVGEDW
jgi:hypothetical protein